MYRACFGALAYGSGYDRYQAVQASTCFSKYCFDVKFYDISTDALGTAMVQIGPFASQFVAIGRLATMVFIPWVELQAIVESNALSKQLHHLQ